MVHVTDSPCSLLRLFVPHATHRFLPYIGMVTIIMNDYPYLKFLLIGVLGLFVLSNRE
jgi:hypothetical protein